MNGFQRSKAADELAEKISPHFSIYEIQQHEGNIYFFGVQKKDARILYQELWTVFAEYGFEFSVRHELGEDVLVGSQFAPAREKTWINVALLIATFFTTMVVGSALYGANPESAPSEVFAAFV